MTLKCEKPEMVSNFISAKYNITSTNPSGDGDKFELAGGLVVNVFKTGTVNFQGNKDGNQTVQDITALVEIINR